MIKVQQSRWYKLTGGFFYVAKKRHRNDLSHFAVCVGIPLILSDCFVSFFGLELHWTPPTRDVKIKSKVIIRS